MTTQRRSRNADPSLAVAYLRVSTEDQRLGPEAQRRAIETHAKRSGLTIVSWHTDQGVSGAAALEDRPALLDAVAALRTHKAGVLIAAKRDRIARDVVVAALVERSIRTAGAQLVTCDGARGGDDPTDRLQRGILDLFAEHERAVIRARTRAALQAKKARGECVGAVQFGYSLASDGVRVEPNLSEQRTIAAARELRAAGITFRAIVDALNATGHRGRTGNLLALAQVQRMLAKS